MDESRRKQFEALIAAEPDDTLLRFGLARMFLEAGLPAEAAGHLAHAVAVDPGYSAAWRELGRARQAAGDTEGARAAWEAGIPAAEAKGDLQTVNEMRVFLSRL
jgi:predicted Zn-dependent protease